MTGDVEEENSMLYVSPELVGSVPSSAVPLADSASFINSNMTVNDGCMYDATVPADSVNGYPEGTVLQMLPNATLITLPIKCLPSSNSPNGVTYKSPSFPSEAGTTPGNLASLLTETPKGCDVSTVSVEGNISDMNMDLSFLNETVVASAISDPKCLTNTAVKELQGMIAEVSQEALGLLQSNLSIPECTEKVSQGIDQPKDSATSAEDVPEDVVMIDVSKPIQLVQNSLIMVNGQKCVLQQDPQTGQVVAYPIKEQEKPKRRRGRPRKTSTEQQMVTNSEEPEPTPGNLEVQSQSEEEAEKGLLEVVNDDGSLVRRSLRKRKKNKVLKDYETGNLQQELGSDIEEEKQYVIDLENDVASRKKKAKGPGRPRKYPKESNTVEALNNEVRRPRGRPRKAVDTEPSQAFLVHTADGQVLMMQVPLSSIPQNMTLQEMAEQIAVKLNQSLSQHNKTLPTSVTETVSQHETSIPEAVETNLPAGSSAVSKDLVQDHSVGSTSNFLNLNLEQPLPGDGSCVGAIENVCQKVTTNVGSMIVDSIGQEEEVVLENSANGTQSDSTSLSLVPEGIFDDPANFTSVEITEANFGVKVPLASASMADESDLCCLEGNVNHIHAAKPPDEHLVDDFEHVQGIHTSKPDESSLCVKDEIAKEKVDFPFLLSSGGESAADVQSLQLEEFLNNEDSEAAKKELQYGNSSGIEKSSYASEIIEDFALCSDRQFEINRIANFHSYYQTRDCFNNGPGPASEPENSSKRATLPNEDAAVKEDIPSNCAVEPSESSCTLIDDSSQLVKTDSGNCNVDILMQAKGIGTSEPLMNNNSISSENPSAVVLVPDKAFVSILPAPSSAESKKCKVCKEFLSTDEELVQHFKSKHPRCICTECDYMAEHPYVIKRHSYRHSNQPCICGICHKSYKDFYILKMHIKMVHMPPDVVYTCNLCDKSFTRKAHLKRHLRIHMAVKEFHCPYCSYKGCEKADLNKHLLIHGDPKFTCDVCGRAFRQMKNRDLHVKRHSGQRDYKCGVCNFYGYTFTDIRKHIERRHKNAVCKDCDTVFDPPEVLREHRASGTCPGNKQLGIKEETQISDDTKEEASLDEMPVKTLESDQVLTVKQCSEETFSALQSGQLVMASVDGMLCNQDGQFVLEGFEECSIVTSDDSPALTSEKDSNKSINLVAADGRNPSFSLKNCSLLPESLSASNELEEQDNCEQIVLTKDTKIPP